MARHAGAYRLALLRTGGSWAAPISAVITTTATSPPSGDQIAAASIVSATMTLMTTVAVKAAKILPNVSRPRSNPATAMVGTAARNSNTSGARSGVLASASASPTPVTPAAVTAHASDRCTVRDPGLIPPPITLLASHQEREQVHFGRAYCGSLRDTPGTRAAPRRRAHPP